MTEKLRKVLSDASSGKGDIWKETEVASRILLAGGYPGHSEDLACLEDIEDCIELENLLSHGSWYFQETDTWKYETQRKDQKEKNPLSNQHFAGDNPAKKQTNQ